MPRKSQTTFTDRFFRVTRKSTHYALGNNHKDIFDSFTKFERNADDDVRLIDASGINVKPDWLIGTFNKPIVVCGHCYPMGTLAVFQGREPGSHFALFSFEEGDETL